MHQLKQWVSVLLIFILIAVAFALNCRSDDCRDPVGFNPHTGEVEYEPCQPIESWEFRD